MPHSLPPETSSSPMGDESSEDNQDSSQLISQDNDVAAVPRTDTDTIDASSPLPAVKDLKVADDDLFDDGNENDDDEWLDSTPQDEGKDIGSEEARSIPTAAPAAKTGIEQEALRAYYQRLLPFRPLFQWLNHSPSPTTDFGHREFAFTLQNDAYLRYQSFPTGDLLRKDVLRLNPSRFEIGPIYSTNPRDRKTVRKSSNFRPLAKELVFDIDLTDYDEIRTCCAKTDICNKCWAFVTMAIKVVDAALRQDFGFRHILWVYSGRRGAHAWVCDRRAREMDDRRRKAVAGYLELIRGGARSGKKVHVKRPLHPHLSRSLDILKDYFQTVILVDQDPWVTSEQADRLLQLLPDKALNEALRKKWDSCPGRSSAAKWADIDALAKAGASRTLDAKALLEAKQDVVLEYTYARLDVEVSKKLNHLLKSPFVVHPGTGRVCVPIDLGGLDEFDPLSVPTVSELLREIDAWDRRNGKEGGGGGGGAGEGEDVVMMTVDGNGNGGAKRVQDYEKTSLKPYVELLMHFAQGLIREEKGSKREREGGAMDAMEF
ncbi:MAG: hypothetical protein M1816_003750 [Peltula sp. TS41687]|nr:MAG: hypothetical protein M1816_003750 [Peltula sp. TS41687]